MTDLNHVARALEARGFQTHCFKEAAEAAAFLLEDMPAGETVAIGGCMTARQMGLKEQLIAAGHPVIWHWDVPHAERHDTLREAMSAPLYVCSANALTADGLIVNIDGTGNRVAATCYGPKTVYFIIGRNKIVEGGYQQAIRRIKQVACPANARRLNLDTPCAKGECSAAQCKNPMCCAVVSLEHAVSAHRMVALLVDEALGF